MAIRDFFNKPRSFWQEYLLIIAIDSLVVFLFSGVFWLLGGSVQISNFYFLSCLIFFIIAALPVFGEWGGNIRQLSKMARGEADKQIIAELEQKAKAGSRRTYLFALAGATAFVLSIVFLNV